MSSEKSKEEASRKEKLAERFNLLKDVTLGIGCVHKYCTDKDNNQYALKIIPLKKLTAKELNRFEREAKICTQLKHSNIVTIAFSAKDAAFYYLVYELQLSNSVYKNFAIDLFEYIREKEYLHETQCSLIVKQILTALQYCHQEHIIHRDLKLENVFIFRRAGEKQDRSVLVKLTNFHFAIQLADNKPGKYGVVGTLSYMSPEMLEHKEYNQLTDIWSVGVICYTLLVGYPPFRAAKRDSLIKKIIQGNLFFRFPDWLNISNDGKNLIKTMLTSNALERINAADALKSQWTNDVELSMRAVQLPLYLKEKV